MGGPTGLTRVRGLQSSSSVGAGLFFLFSVWPTVRCPRVPSPLCVSWSRPCFSRSAHAATRCSPWGNTCCDLRYGCCKRTLGSDVAVKTESNRQWVLTTCWSLPQDHGISNSVVRLGFPTGDEIPQLYGLYKARRVNTTVRAAQQYLDIVYAQAVLLLPTTT